MSMKKGYYKHPNEELHKRLAETHDRVVELELALGDRIDSSLARLEAELSTLKGLLEKGFNPEFIGTKLSGIEKGLADHEIRISSLEAGFAVIESETARAHARVTDVEKVVAEDRKVTRTTERRVTVLEAEIRRGLPIFGTVLGIIAGIIAGVLWARQDWSSVVTPAGTSVTASSAADKAICAWLFGAGVGFAVLAVVSIFSRVFQQTRAEEVNINEHGQEVFSKRSEVRAEELDERPGFLDDVEESHSQPTEIMPAAKVVANF